MHDLNRIQRVFHTKDCIIVAFFSSIFNFVFVLTSAFSWDLPFTASLLHTIIVKKKLVKSAILSVESFIVDNRLRVFYLFVWLWCAFDF